MGAECNEGVDRQTEGRTGRWRPRLCLRQRTRATEVIPEETWEPAAPPPGRSPALVSHVLEASDQQASTRPLPSQPPSRQEPDPTGGVGPRRERSPGPGGQKGQCPAPALTSAAPLLRPWAPSRQLPGTSAHSPRVRAQSQPEGWALGGGAARGGQAEAAWSQPAAQQDPGRVRVESP